MSRAPIVPLIVGNNGSYGFVRSSPAQGSCGTKSYPCRHPGVDVVGKAGTDVHAPEDGTVIAAADGNSAPYGGYGPWLIVMLGASGKYHLLGHLDPAYLMMAPVGLKVSEGQVVGKTSSTNHTHWEVRRKPYPNFSAGEDNFTNNEDPQAWLSGGGGLLIAALVIGAGALFYLARRR